MTDIHYRTDASVNGQAPDENGVENRPIQTERMMLPQEPLHWFWPFDGYRVPELLEKGYYQIAETAHKARFATLQAVPYYVVNSSSNLIGGLDVAAEVMMLKSNGMDFVAEKNRGKPLNYIFEPPVNIVKTVFGGADVHMPANPGDLLKPSHYYRTIKSFSNLAAASYHDSMGGKIKLVNRWQGRATLASIVGMAIAATLPDEKDTPAEVERNAQLLHDDPLAYVGKRLWQAVYFPDWVEYKREFAGLGKMLAGGITVLSGFRNVDTVHNVYFPNRAHAFNGIVTALAGAQLLFGLDDQHAWSNFGKTMMCRTVLLPWSIKNRFDHNDGRAMYYVGAQGLFRVQDATAYLIGGAEKTPEGDIINKQAIRENAWRKAQEEAQAQEKPDDQTPGGGLLRPFNLLIPSPRDVSLLEEQEQKQVMV